MRYISQLSDMGISAKSERLKAKYETQLDQKAQELEEMEEEPIANADLKIPYRTVLNKSIGLLIRPYFAWKKLGLVEQHCLSYFIFTEKLEYADKEGYRIDKLPSAVRLFEDFVNQNSLWWRWRESNPRPRRCMYARLQCVDRLRV